MRWMSATLKREEPTCACGAAAGLAHRMANQGRTLLRTCQVTRQASLAVRNEFRSVCLTSQCNA